MTDPIQPTPQPEIPPLAPVASQPEIDPAGTPTRARPSSARTTARSAFRVFSRTSVDSQPVENADLRNLGGTAGFDIQPAAPVQ
jgi:hypothetical protein